MRYLYIKKAMLKDAIFIAKYYILFIFNLGRLYFQNTIRFKEISFKYYIEKRRLFDYSLTELKNINNYIANTYEAEVRDKIISYIDKDTTCIDIGAHHGLYTLLMSRLGHEVFAFEANPHNYQRQQYNVEMNKCENVHCNNIVLSEKPTKLNFLLSKNSFLSQIDDNYFLSDELSEFDELVLQKVDPDNLLNLKGQLNNHVRNKSFLRFIKYLYKIIHQKRNDLQLADFELILDTVNRYVRYFDRYICETLELEAKPFDDFSIKTSGKKFFMKFDVEGSEFLVIKGSNNFISKMKPTLFVESTEIEGIAEYLETFGYKMEKIDFKSYFFTL